MSDTVLPRAMISVVHPLDDQPEQKLYRPDLGRMRMTMPVRLALLVLQAYLAAMVLLVGWRMFTTL
jgi:hypothetical protein